MSRSVVLMLAAVLLLTGLSVGVASPASQAQDGAERGRGRNGPPEPASYINPDTGLATENPGVKPNSECRTPDRADSRVVSPPGTTTNNVHNDACLFHNGKAFDGRVSFEIRGPGTFNACPDPDGSGPKTGTVKREGKRCYLTGYQETGLEGDREYHARINHTGNPGKTFVTFCHDPNDNGCRDAELSRMILIRWVSQ